MEQQNKDLDGGGVYIGKKTLIAPNVHIYTAGHPKRLTNATDLKCAVLSI